MSKSRLISLQGSVFDLATAPVKQPKSIKEGAPVQKAQSAYEGTDNRAEAGMWESTAGSWNVNVAGYTEFCVLLEGQVIIHDEAGNENVFNAGDSLVMEDGFKGVWHVPNYVRKYFFIVNS